MKTSMKIKLAALLCALLFLLQGCDTAELKSYVGSLLQEAGEKLQESGEKETKKTKKTTAGDKYTDRTTAEKGRGSTTAPGAPEHAFLLFRDGGACERLTGDVYLTVIFVTDSGSVWTGEDMNDIREGIEEAASLLESSASAFGAELDLIPRYVEAGTSVTFVREDSIDWADSVLADAGFGDFEEAPSRFADLYGAHPAPVLFYRNCSGRAFAHCGVGFEYSVLFSGDGDFRHELLHIFGACDFYYPDEVEEIAVEQFAESVMISSSCPVVDDLTAYIVGWTEELSPSAEGFLEATAHMTREYLDEARAQEQFTGYGTIRYSDGTVYEGYATYGSPDGKGVMRWADGSIYEGDFVDGDCTGKGVIRWPSGNAYEGDFVDGDCTGKGVYYWAEGGYYEGDFLDGKLHGYGYRVYSNGNSYEGQYSDGKRNGWGTFRWAGGDRYEGEYADDKRTGYGTYYWADGDVYEGGFLNDVRHGAGKYTFSDGSVLEGRWENGEYVGK